MSRRRAIVTGGASGIGAATAALLTDRGHDVVVLDRQPASTEAHAIAVDLADPDAAGEAVGAAIALLDGLDLLVCCAGITRRGTVEETSVALWDEVFAVNVRAAYLAAAAALPALRAGADPSIVNVASQFGIIGTGGYVAYCASKAALINLTRAMAVDHGPEGVRVNVVCPGPTDTPMLRADQDAGDVGRAGVDAVLARTFSGRPAPAEQCAEVIAFAGSPAAAAINGAVLVADDGYTVH